MGGWMSTDRTLTLQVRGIVAEGAAEVKESGPQMRVTYADYEDFPRQILIFNVS